MTRGWAYGLSTVRRFTYTVTASALFSADWIAELPPEHGSMCRPWNHTDATMCAQAVCPSWPRHATVGRVDDLAVLIYDPNDAASRWWCCRTGRGDLAGLERRWLSRRQLLTAHPATP